MERTILMFSYKHISIRHKLVFVILLTTASALLLMNAALILYDISKTKRSLLNSLIVQAKITGSNSTAALAFNDKTAAEEILSSLQASPNITHAIIYAQDGSVFARYQRQDISETFIPPTPLQKDSSLFYINHLELFQSITLDNRKIGTLFVRSDFTDLYSRMKWHIISVFIIMIIVLYLSFLMSAKLQRTITAPILDLLSVMNIISKDKNYSLRASLQSRDEMGILAEGFNTMLTQIQERDTELELHRNNLNKLVAKRTDELEDANRQLQQELSIRKLAEYSLALEKEQLAVTLGSITDGVITTDTDGNIILMNKVAEGMTGWTLKESAGKPLSDVFPVMHEKDRAPCEAPVKKVVETGGPVDCGDYIILTNRQGKERIITASSAPLRDKDNKIIGAVIVFQDMSVRKKMEEDILKAQKLESLGVLAGGIAHDFNNLLTAILGNVSLAKMLASPQDKIYERLTSAEKASLRARDLTQQLLTFSKGGAPVKKATSLSELIKDSVSFALSGSHVTCEFSFPDDLWVVEVDEGQISQVIQNLIINAEQAMPEGGRIRVSCKNLTVSEEEGLPLKEGTYVRISVQDQGGGIPPKYLQRIFDPYFTTKEKGRGLGLATVYSIIRNHNGYITLDSETGVGTTFRIYLPASQGKIVTQRIESREVRSAKGKILLMDDEEVVRESMREILTFAGYEVEPAQDGTEAIDRYVKAKAADKPFDAVIMDLTIPGGMGGKEAIQRLTEIDPEIKAIVSSGYSNDPIMANFREYGFRGAVSKPYKVSEITDTLYVVLTDAKE
jgi:PAS domain S-box-containing protein